MEKIAKNINFSKSPKKTNKQNKQNKVTRLTKQIKLNKPTKLSKRNKLNKVNETKNFKLNNIENFLINKENYKYKKSFEINEKVSFIKNIIYIFVFSIGLSFSYVVTSFTLQKFTKGNNYVIEDKIFKDENDIVYKNEKELNINTISSNFEKLDINDISNLNSIYNSNSYLNSLRKTNSDSNLNSHTNTNTDSNSIINSDSNKNSNINKKQLINNKIISNEENRLNITQNHNSNKNHYNHFKNESNNKKIELGNQNYNNLNNEIKLKNNETFYTTSDVKELTFQDFKNTKSDQKIELIENTKIIKDEDLKLNNQNHNNNQNINFTNSNSNSSNFNSKADNSVQVIFKEDGEEINKKFIFNSNNKYKENQNAKLIKFDASSQILKYKKLFEKCKLYFDEKEYEKSKNCLQEYLTYNENSEAALFYLAQVYYKTKMYAQSSSTYKHILYLNPNNEISRLNLAINLMKQKSYKESEQQLNLLLKNNLKNWRIKFYLAKLNLFKKSFKTALININEALKLNPNEAMSLQLRGEIYFNLKNYDLSILDFKNSLNKNKTSYSTWVMLAKSYEKENQNAEAIEAYLKAKKIYQLDSELFYELGNLYLEEQDYPKAMNNFELSFQIKPINPKICLTIMLAKNKLEVKSNFYEILQKNIEALPTKKENYQFFITAADFYLLNKNENEALSSLRKSINSDPEKVEAYLKMAKIFRSQNNLRNLELVYNELLENNPNYVEGHFKLGILYQKELKHYKKAKFHFNKYLSYYPLSPKKNLIETLLKTL